MQKKISDKTLLKGAVKNGATHRAATKKKRKVSEHKKLEKQCLSLWSQCVIARDRTCRNCNSDEYLSAHHVRSVSNHNTMFDIDNGLCLCWRKCHFPQKYHPERFQDMVLNIIGQEKYDYLKAKSLITRKWSVSDLTELKEYLKNKLQEFKSA
jgi:hypothetical protein